MKDFKPMDNLQDLQPFREAGGVNPSISDSSTYTFLSGKTMADTFANKTEGHYLYSRHSSPGTLNLGEALAALEGTETANVTASGMAAISSTFLQLCSTGDHIVSARTIYGGTYALLKNLMPKLGISTSFVDGTDLSNIEKAIQPNTKVLFCESISNPLLEVSDIPKIAKIARRHDLTFVVDNTFSPLVIPAAKLGADVVIHSLTKFINGTSDAIGGVICGTNDFIDSLRDVKEGTAMLLGATMDGFRAASILKNLQTLHLRMKQHGKNALYLAEHLEKDGVKIVYPGLKSHPSYELFDAIGNMEFGFGGMLSLDAGNIEKSYALMELLQKRKVGYLAVSLGFYKTLFSASGNSTSSEIPEEERAEMGVSDGLIRFSVGLDNNIERTYRIIRDCLKKLDLLP